MGSIVHAYIQAGEVRAVAELRRLHADWGADAEAAFSVERGWQSRGIASGLIGHVICSARNRGVRRLLMSCLAENRKIQAIALKHNAQLSYEQGDVVGIITPGDATCFSHMEESVSDELDFMIPVFDIANPFRKTA